MNGAHDMGGMHGFGPIEIEPDEPLFHARSNHRLNTWTTPTMSNGCMDLRFCWSSAASSRKKS